MIVFLRCEGARLVRPPVLGRRGQEILEKGAVVYQGLAQILGVRFAARAAARDVVGDPVVAHQFGVVHRQVGRAVLEVADGVAARAHHLGEQLVRLSDRRARIVNEPGLHLPPALRELRRLAGRQCVQIKRVHALFAMA